MAIVNPSTLYNGGNVRLDSTPYLNLAIRERQRKEARGYAIDQYYQRLPENINDKGVRNQEVPIIGDLKNRMVQTYIENRDALRKGDPNAQMQMQQLFREAQAVTRKSQGASQIDMKAATMALDKNNQEILNNEGFVERHRRQTLPVTDPDYQPLDLSHEMAERPFNPDNYAKQLRSQVKYGEGIPTITVHPTDKNLEVVTTNPVLDDQTKQNLYEGAAYKLHNDVSFQRALQKNFSTPEQIAPLNEISKKVFGHEIKEPEDIAAAYTASLLPSQTTRASVRASVDAQHQWQEDQMNKRFAHAEKMQRMNDRLIRSRKVDGVDEVEVGYPTNEVVEEYGVDETLQTVDGKVTKTILYEDEVPVGTMRSMNPRDDNKGVRPVKPKAAKQPDGSFRNYWDVEKDENGNINLVGAGGKKIGAEDGRNNYIKEVVPTKAKLQINKSKPTSTKPTTATSTKKGKYD